MTPESASRTESARNNSCSRAGYGRSVKRRLLLLVLVLVVPSVAGLYVYGTLTCPPPDWWLQLFLRSGNYGCVA